MTISKLRFSLLTATMMALASAGALADVLSTQAARLDSVAASQGDTRVSSGIAGDFTTFSGSPENAGSLVNGLRTGSSITLTDPTAPPGTASGLSFTPPTRPMGYGNIFISLSLAQKQLTNMGITNPTPTQLQAALTGGTVLTANGPVTLKGILQMRADGMGWGKIAQTLGFKLGPVVSGLKQATAAASHPGGTGITSADGSRGTTPGGQSKGHGSGIVSANGTTPGSAASGKGNQGKNPSAPISTGMGSGIGNGIGTGAGTGMGAGGGAGITSAAGSNAGGNGMGQARGHGKP